MIKRKDKENPRLGALILLATSPHTSNLKP